MFYIYRPDNSLTAKQVPTARRPNTFVYMYCAKFRQMFDNFQISLDHEIDIEIPKPKLNLSVFNYIYIT